MALKINLVWNPIRKNRCIFVLDALARTDSLSKTPSQIRQFQDKCISLKNFVRVYDSDRKYNSTQLKEMIDVLNYIVGIYNSNEELQKS